MKVALEQKVLFEKDVVNCITQNIATIRDLNEGQFRNIVYELVRHQGPRRQIDSLFLADLKVRHDWQMRVTSIELMMNSYVDQFMCSRFETLDGHLFTTYLISSTLLTKALQQKNIDSAIDLMNDQMLRSVDGLDTNERQFRDFMRDFHVAILK
jgi:hypothetical protein